MICPNGHVFEPSFCVWGVIVGIPRRCDGMGQGAIGSPIRKFLIEWNEGNKEIWGIEGTKGGRGEK